MLVIPAIDLKQGKVVRLSQGRMEEGKEYADDPPAVARRWEAAGAELIHVVDLDGAFAGKPMNREAVIAIAKAIKVPIELGGGIRDLETILGYLADGVSRVILGTVAHQNPELVRAACREFPGRIVIGIDARDGKISIQGWTERTELSAVELAHRYEDKGVAALIFTDIARDGMMTGPALESTLQLARAVRLPLIASGGIKTLDHIKAVAALEKEGVAGVITGRAIYEGSLDLTAAIRLAKGEKT